MQNNFVVVTDSNVLEGLNINEEYLFEKRLFKTLSLLLSTRCGIHVPSTLLMLKWNFRVLRQFVKNNNKPLMIRMDFMNLPKNKPLGGIPIYREKSMKMISEYLIAKKCFPIYHPHYDRFDDMYSVGVLLCKNDYNAKIEIVGNGFDASDIRLGQFLPHEIMNINMIDDTISNRMLISNKLYKEERKIRMIKINMLLSYIHYANKFGKLVSSFKQIENIHKNINRKNINRDITIPPSYLPIPYFMLKDLIKISGTIHSGVLPYLPSSKMYVISLSYLPEKGWVLWDIYGGWYKR